jgi:hypothetical protein
MSAREESCFEVRSDLSCVDLSAHESLKNIVTLGTAKNPLDPIMSIGAPKRLSPPGHFLGANARLGLYQTSTEES